MDFSKLIESTYVNEPLSCGHGECMFNRCRCWMVLLQVMEIILYTSKYYEHSYLCFFVWSSIFCEKLNWKCVAVKIENVWLLCFQNREKGKGRRETTSESHIWNQNEWEWIQPSTTERKKSRTINHKITSGKNGIKDAPVLSVNSTEW